VKEESTGMLFLAARAYLQLIHFDGRLARGDFRGLYDEVRNCPVGKTVPFPDVIVRICAAMDLACIWYWKEVRCLQRSAATTCLLKRFGVPAQMVIGAQHMPFQAHAWVEAGQRVVSDKPYMPEIYVELDRC
jgi:hypothetical protein